MNSTRLAFYTLLLFLLSACDSEGIGSGAGDSSIANPEAVALISPLQGIYDLPDNWRGDAPNAAFLQIDSPDQQGRAQTFLIDINDDEQCVPSRLSSGVVFQDPTSDRIFMDGLVDFLDAILSLSGDTLIIELQSDPLDIDMDTITSEAVELPSPAFFGDLPPACP